MAWTPEHIPDLSGRLAIVTGAGGGLGLATTRRLARRGARVLMAVRDRDKATSVREAILADMPNAAVELRDLDLASLSSIRAFAAELRTDRTPVDILVNNAGVMAIPRRLTADGFEMQLGVNHLGHFALTALVLPLLLTAPAARIVNVSSSGRFYGRPLNLADPYLARHYDPWRAYGQSKLANVHFTVELASRLAAAGSAARCLAADPGLSRTNLQVRSYREAGGRSQRFFQALAERWGSTPEQGAWPQLRAATDPGAENGRLYGLRFGVRGAPVRIPMPARERDTEARERLWAFSERETGIRLSLA